MNRDDVTSVRSGTGTDNCSFWGDANAPEAVGAVEAVPHWIKGEEKIPWHWAVVGMKRMRPDRSWK